MCGGKLSTNEGVERSRENKRKFEYVILMDD